jgi:hypothetical protein
MTFLLDLLLDVHPPTPSAIPNESARRKYASSPTCTDLRRVWTPCSSRGERNVPLSPPGWEAGDEVCWCRFFARPYAPGWNMRDEVFRETSEEGGVVVEMSVCDAEAEDEGDADVEVDGVDEMEPVPNDRVEWDVGGRVEGYADVV